jgi:hypothetical protein
MAKEMKLTDAQRAGLILRITQNANKNPAYFDHVQEKLNQKAQETENKKVNNQQVPSKEQKKIALKKILQYLKDQKNENYEKTNNINRSAENSNEAADSEKSASRP